MHQRMRIHLPPKAPRHMQAINQPGVPMSGASPAGPSASPAAPEPGASPAPDTVAVESPAAAATDHGGTFLYPMRRLMLLLQSLCEQRLVFFFFKLPEHWPVV